MGTRSKTTVFDEQNKPVLSFYRQMDGYYGGMGQELQDFLSEMVIINGYGSGTSVKTANGMTCLAAQLVAYFKDGIGLVYICPHDDEQEYNYDIHYVKPGRVSLLGSGECATPPRKVFKLYSDDILPPKILKTVQFVYDKNSSDYSFKSEIKWRVVQVTNEDSTYLEGLDVDDNLTFKRFLKSKIVGGRILPV
jgi:hypothetical protein